MSTMIRFVAISWLWLPGSCFKPKCEEGSGCATDVQAPSLMQVRTSKSQIQDADLAVQGVDYYYYDYYYDYYDYVNHSMAQLKKHNNMQGPACDCSCYGNGYVFDDRGHGEPDCWIPGLGFDIPCCEAKPPACDCSCHEGNYVFDDRGHGEPDCWIKDIGYDKPCCEANPLESITLPEPGKGKGYDYHFDSGKGKGYDDHKGKGYGSGSGPGDFNHELPTGPYYITETGAEELSHLASSASGQEFHGVLIDVLAEAYGAERRQVIEHALEHGFIVPPDFNHQLPTVAPGPVEYCSTNLDFEGDSHWIGRCFTLVDCMQRCGNEDGCEAFNWWPDRGGCTFLGTGGYKTTNTTWTVVGGTPACVLAAGLNFSAPFENLTECPPG